MGWSEAQFWAASTDLIFSTLEFQALEQARGKALRIHQVIHAEWEK